MNVLMIGATGSNAGLVLPELKSRGVTVRALVRDPDKAAAVRDRGADETVLGDLTDPESLRAAAKGMDGVFHINPAFAPQEADLGVAMVHAAQSQGVRKFVFSGVMHPTLADSGQPRRQGTGRGSPLHLGYGLHRPAARDVHADARRGLGQRP